jgi:uncharacterized protein YfaP (DUF2135 family)
MPGNYRTGGGTPAPMEAFGGLDVRFTDSTGAPLVLATGVTATVRIPVSSRNLTLPTTVPLFHFDSAAGSWTQAGTASLQGTSPNQYYEGTIDRLGAWSTAQLYSAVSVTGCVQDAGGTRIAGATVVAEGRDYVGSSQATTDASGSFTVSVKANSLAFLQATRGIAISNSPEVTTQTANITLSTCLTLSGRTLSIKLTWGQTPSDLDSHTLGANASDHIYYISRGDLAGQPYIGLDVDDVTGFGPEVTTFARLASNRRYSFYVHNYSGESSPGQTASPARVELTNAGIQTIFTPPAGETAQTRYWHVFDLTTDATCAITVVPVQTFLAVEPVNANVGNSASFCN